jgi:hypothetical protein
MLNPHSNLLSIQKLCLYFLHTDENSPCALGGTRTDIFKLNGSKPVDHRLVLYGTEIEPKQCNVSP